MELKKIYLLLEKYYSGDILPEEYADLLAALKQSEDLTPDLESERKLLLVLDSYQPKMPDGFEKRIDEAISQRLKRQKRKGTWLISCLSGSVAASILIGLIVGPQDENQMSSHPKFVAEASIKRQIHEPVKEEIDEKEPVNNEKVCIDKKTSEIPDPNEEELMKNAKKVNDALLEVISGIRMGQDNVNECLEEMQIDQKTNFNIF